MKNTAIEKLSYTEVTKNISQAEYNQTQEEYILSKSPDKYMISLPVKVLMFEGAKDSSPFTYYFYMENDEDLYLMQRKRNGSVVDKTKIPLTKEQGQKILDGDYQFLLDSDEPLLNSLYFQFNLGVEHIAQELLTLATSIEGHPDNVAPALLGGLTSSVFEDGVVYSVKRDVDESLCFAAIVPDYKLLTEAARAALPKEVTHKDAVYNLSRAALIPAAFCEGRHDLLAIATEDKLHQPYRMPLMPGSKEVFDMARLCGAKAVYVSGAGSTVMAVAEKANAEKFYSKLEKGLELLEGLDGCEAFTLLRLDADNTGATVE